MSSGPQRGDRADRRGFLADVEVHRAMDFALRILIEGRLLEGTRQLHFQEHVFEHLRGEIKLFDRGKLQRGGFWYHSDNSMCGMKSGCTFVTRNST